MQILAGNSLSSPMTCNILPTQLSVAMFRIVTLACIASNQTRSQITQSSTHIQANDLSPQQRAHLVQAIETMRTNIDKTTNAILSQDPLLLLPTTAWLILANEAEQALQHKMGNCAEMTFVTLYYLLKLNPAIQVCIVRIKHGDHTFLIVNLDSQHTAADFTHWSNAIVVDTWHGTIYFKQEIPQKLFTSRRVALDENDYCNVVELVALAHQPLESILSFPAPDLMRISCIF